MVVKHDRTLAEHGHEHDHERLFFVTAGKKLAEACAAIQIVVGLLYSGRLIDRLQDLPRAAV